MVSVGAQGYLPLRNLTNLRPFLTLRPRSTSLSRSGGDFESHFKFSGGQTGSHPVSVPWTEDWFKDLVEFRKKAYWDCHAETTKI